MPNFALIKIKYLLHLHYLMVFVPLGLEYMPLKLKIWHRMAQYIVYSHMPCLDHLSSVYMGTHNFTTSVQFQVTCATGITQYTSLGEIWLGRALHKFIGGCQMSPKSVNRVSMRAPEYPEVGHIWGFWPHRHDMMLLSRWNLMQKRTR